MVRKTSTPLIKQSQKIVHTPPLNPIRKNIQPLEAHTHYWWTLHINQWYNMCLIVLFNFLIYWISKCSIYKGKCILGKICSILNKWKMPIVMEYYLHCLDKHPNEDFWGILLYNQPSVPLTLPVEELEQLPGTISVCAKLLTKPNPAYPFYDNS